MKKLYGPATPRTPPVAECRQPVIHFVYKRLLMTGSAEGSDS